MDAHKKEIIKNIIYIIGIIASLFGIIGLNAFNIYGFLKQHTNIPIIVVLILVILTLLIWGFIYIFVKKKKRKGIYFIIGGIFILIILISVSIYPMLSDRNKIVILLADFEEPDSESYHITKIIKRQLDKHIKEFDDIKVKRLNKVLDNDDVAIEKGKELKASIVIWGSCDETKKNARVIAHFNTLKKMPSYHIKNDKQELTVSLGELENFHIQDQLSGEMTYLTLFTIGLVNYLSEDYNNSIIQFTNAINNKPPEQMVDASLIYFFRGNAYLFLNNSYLAIGDYNKAIEIDPKDADVYNNRGGVYTAKGEIELAIRDYNKAIEIDPKDADVYNNRGSAYWSKGELELAIRDYNKAIEIDPELASAYYNRGNAYDDEGEIELAIRDYSKAIELNPKDAAYVNRGNVYSDKGEIELAIRDYNKAIELDPKCAPAYYNRGLAYQKKGEIGLAEKDFNKAIALDPKLKSLLSK